MYKADFTANLYVFFKLIFIYIFGDFALIQFLNRWLGNNSLLFKLQTYNLLLDSFEEIFAYFFTKFSYVDINVLPPTTTSLPQTLSKISSRLNTFPGFEASR
jgi:hypothetical protein